jgi:NTE family protein
VEENDERVVMDAAALLNSSAIFGELSKQERAELWSRAKPRALTRGTVLICKNTPADTVYVVVSGRFEVWRDGQPDAEIGVGELIGEIAFFAGGPRTATIVAARDSLVLELDRASFESVARTVPTLYQTLLRALARRLAESSARIRSERRVEPVRTVAVIVGGWGRIPPAFFDRLHSVVERRGKGLVLTYELLKTHFPNRALDDPTVSNWLNAIEHQYDLIAYVADDTLTDWTRKVIRQADEVLIIGLGDAPDGLNPVEAFAFATHRVARRRLVRLHDHRIGFVEGTAAWLRDRDVGMHHHVALEDDADFKSLHRFLIGRAVGFVAAGGGGFGPAHVGIYKAFQERGVTFDLLGGASVGAAVLAGFAFLLSPEDVDNGIDDVFVKSRGFKRLTLPRYALVDHTKFDEALRRQYRGISIEDAWRPYFAVATVLDRSGEPSYVLRRGPLWRAVRASGSLPAVLPPVFTDDGRILVDGGIANNIPLEPMKALKQGPNLVVHFGVHEMQRFPVDYMSIPGRWQLLARMLTPAGRRKLPAAPGPINVVQRCLLMNQSHDRLPVGPLDLVLAVPDFPGANFMDFDRHFDVFQAAYAWCSTQIHDLGEQGCPALAAILATRD